MSLALDMGADSEAVNRRAHTQTHTQSKCTHDGSCVPVSSHVVGSVRVYVLDFMSACTSVGAWGRREGDTPLLLAVKACLAMHLKRLSTKKQKKTYNLSYRKFKAERFNSLPQAGNQNVVNTLLETSCNAMHTNAAGAKAPNCFLSTCRF